MQRACLLTIAFHSAPRIEGPQSIYPRSGGPLSGHGQYKKPTAGSDSICLEATARVGCCDGRLVGVLVVSTIQRQVKGAGSGSAAPSGVLAIRRSPRLSG